MLQRLLVVTACVALAAPWLTFLLIAAGAWFARPLSERQITRLAAATSSLAALSCIAALGAFALGGTPMLVDLGTWLAFEGHQLQFTLTLDSLSLPVAGFGALLVGVVGSFSRRYLHREPGFARFYLLLALLSGSYQLVVLAGSFEIMLLGWELVGLSSALLIAFFHHRAGPVRHGFRAFVTYRVCDVALITAAIWLHHLSAAPFGFAGEPWAGPAVPASASAAGAIGLLVAFASLGKSAQFPFTGWLPRAMEGPTPSSAIFYGALSIHLGPYLLLRAYPLLAASPGVSAAVVIVGLLTTLHGTFVGRAQTDVKSALAYASATQVGIIFVEIGLGFTRLALLHMLGHAAIRSLQILRSPSLLHDHHHLEQAMASQLPRTGRHLERLIPARWQPWLYRYALERGYLDSFLEHHLAAPLARLLRGIDRLERQWTAWLGGARPNTPSETTDAPKPVEVPR